MARLSPLVPISDANACVDCPEIATRRVEVTAAEDSSPMSFNACAEHARKYSANGSLHKVRVRLMTLTTSVMPAPLRSRHVKVALRDNGISVSEHGLVTHVTSEHVGPTHVHCNDVNRPLIEEILRFQGWDVHTSQDFPGELIILHGSPEKVLEPGSPGIASAVKTIRFDELNRIADLVDGLIADGGSPEEVAAFGLVHDLLNARRIELGEGEI